MNRKQGTINYLGMLFKEKIDVLLNEFKQGKYIYGDGCMDRVGDVAAGLGTTAMLVRSHFPGIGSYVDTLKKALNRSGVTLLKEEVDLIRPNAPDEDMERLRKTLAAHRPGVVISLGGGSTIDAVKAAIVLDVLGGGIEEYFGVNQVTDTLARTGKTLTPHIAIQTAASSAAHLTKYSNITNLVTSQKKLIVDEAVVPTVSLFDYGITYGTPPDLTLDGALDGMSHCMEVFFGSVGKPHYQKAKEIATTAITLIVRYLPVVINDPSDREARNGLCAATDLGGYAIMIGGTSGAHLTSFSLVDLLSHGRACALMNPYYAVFYAPAIQDPLRELGQIYRDEGYSTADFKSLQGRDLGIAFAEAMIEFARQIQFPTTLDQIEGFRTEHIERALSAAKNPQLKSKLENMPVPLTSELVDAYMGSILHAARTGDLNLIKTL